MRNAILASTALFMLIVGASFVGLLALSPQGGMTAEVSTPFTPLEAERPAASRGDECDLALANAGSNAPCELLKGFTESDMSVPDAPSQEMEPPHAVAPSISITGSWIVTRFGVGEEEWKDTDWRAVFDDGGMQAKICNSMGGSIRVEGDFVKTEALSSTLMGCEENLAEAEAAFGRFFQNGAHASYIDRTLVFISEDKKTTLELVPSGDAE